MSNILHITHRYWPVIGGSEQSVQAIAERQAEAGHAVTVLATDADEFSAFWDPKAARLDTKKEQYKDVNIVRTSISYLPGRPWSFGILRRLQIQMGWFDSISAYVGRLAPYLPELTADLSELGFDWQAIFAWNITFDGLMAAAVQKAAQCDSKFIAVPFLHLGEGPNSPVRRYYTMPHQIAYLQSADRVIVQSKLAKDFLVQNNVSGEHIAVIGTGIDPQEVSNSDASAFRLRHDIHDPIVTAIGPLTYDKGTMQLVEASQLLWTAGQSFKLVLAGSIGADFKSYWQKAPPLVQEQTLILGFISQDEKRDLLAAAELLALPSRTDSFGMVLLEAWLHAKPVIGASSGGIPEVIEDGVDGRLVPFGDPGALAQAIAEILLDPRKAKDWGLAGQRKTLTNYTWDAVYQRFETTTQFNTKNEDRS
jgi:glycosyltransferase involved in cell wall biosynthesis